MTLKDVAEDECGITMHHIELPEDLGSDEREFYMTTLKVESLPMIIAVNSGTIRTFGYDEITSKTYKDDFVRFILGR